MFLLSQLLLDCRRDALAGHLSALRLFRYITVRSAARPSRRCVELVARPKIILWLKQLKFGQDYTDKAEEPRSGRAGFEQKRNADDGRHLIVAVLFFRLCCGRNWTTKWCC